ncbi:hypothetical protein MTO96_002779 [Rhipicephalus appendiculatus]
MRLRKRMVIVRQPRRDGRRNELAILPEEVPREGTHAVKDEGGVREVCTAYVRSRPLPRGSQGAQMEALYPEAIRPSPGAGSADKPSARTAGTLHSEPAVGIDEKTFIVGIRV